MQSSHRKARTFTVVRVRRVRHVSRMQFRRPEPVLPDMSGLVLYGQA